MEFQGKLGWKPCKDVPDDRKPIVIDWEVIQGFDQHLTLISIK